MQLNISPSLNIMSSDNILAYRPSYNDGHGSNFAALFINLKAVYPCITSYTHINYSQVKMMDFVEERQSLKQAIMEQIFRFLEAPL